LKNKGLLIYLLIYSAASPRALLDNN